MSIVVLLCPECGACTDLCTIVTVNPFADLSAFTQVGTVTIASGAAVLETGEALVTIAGPTNFYDPVILTVTAETAETSGTLRLAVARLDADNYLFGEYDFAGTTGTLRLGRRVGGVETWLTSEVEVDDTTGLGDSTTFSVCWVPGPVQTGGSFLIDAIYPLNAEVSVPGDWDDPDLTLVDDGTYATCDFNSGPGTGGVCEITWRAFPISLPPGSTIDNLAVGIMCRRKVLTGFGPINLTGLWISKADGTSGNNLGASQVVPSPVSPGEIGASEDLATWGSDMTWDHFNAGVLSVTAEFTQGPSAGDFLEIDYCVVSIDYTTPDRQPGRLTISRGNVTAMTVDCAKNYQAESPGTGKQAAVSATSGTWDLASLTYGYHQSPSRLTCPACECAGAIQCNCCAEGFPPAAEIVVDFGAGGLTDGCDFCDQLAGEYVLEPVAACWWEYREPVDDCDLGGLSVITELRIILLLSNAGGLVGDEACSWSLRVFAMARRKDTNEVGGDAFLFYASDPMDSDEDCQFFPVTMNSTFFNGAPCGGTPPATITLESP